jgi:hypothetical protein
MGRRWCECRRPQRAETDGGVPYCAGCLRSLLPDDPRRASRGPSAVNEFGEIVRDEVPAAPEVDWREQPPLDRPPAGLFRRSLGGVPAGGPYRSRSIWCQCRTPLPENLVASGGLVRCPSCRLMRFDGLDSPPNDPPPPALKHKPPEPPTLESGGRLWIVLLALLAALASAGYLILCLSS